MDISARIKRENEKRPIKGIVIIYFADGSFEEMQYEDRLDRCKIITMASALNCTHYDIIPHVFIAETTYILLDENYPETEE